MFVFRSQVCYWATFPRNLVPSCHKTMLPVYLESFVSLEVILILLCNGMTHMSSLCTVLPHIVQYSRCSTLPFFGLLSSLPSLSSLSSRSLQRRTCSSLIFKKRILFCSSLRASSTSGSTHMSSRIFASILPLSLGLPETTVSPSASQSNGSCFSGGV